MVARQRALISAADYVAEGRDIGTVVSPDAPLKVFLTASDEERARAAGGRDGRAARLGLPSRSERDERDRGREHGALRVADDAVESTPPASTPDAVVERVAGRSARRARGRVSPGLPRRWRSSAFRTSASRTLVNRLAGGREAVTHAEPGVTRDRSALDCEWNGLRFDLVDTGGVDLADERPARQAVQGQARAAIAEADVVAARRRRPRRPRPGRRRSAKLLRGARASRSRRRQQDRPCRDERAGRRIARARPGRAAWRSRPRTASAPATCSTGSRAAAPSRRPRGRAERRSRRGSRSSAARTSASPRSSTPSSAASG